MAKVPKFVKREIKKIAKDFGKDKSELAQEYADLFKSLSGDMQFETDEDKHNYCVRALRIHTASGRPSGPSKEFELIPWGYSEARKTQSGKTQSRIYVYKLDDGETKTIVCEGDQADLWKSVDLFNRYDTQLGDSEGAMFANDDTKFEDSEPISDDPIEFLTDKVGTKKITLSETPNNYSRVQDDGGFVDELDVRLIEGLILDRNTGERKDGSKWGYYRIGDESIGKEEVTGDGKVVPKRFTVWCPPSQIEWEVNSTITVCGTITGENEPSMNACAVVPVHPIPIGGET